ncbi:hypothetical protein QBC35DRAFT_387028 [Podospora australis]|uniref:Pyruvate dehydrogenase complex protein X component, mitochondrial n=1 Tax=Podospora australis TaxID=1536484 RepID=A0AAN6WU66_9PEZI|nr:hypothetical protein QBC35DRAFT_387028 [Podospora australis]
MASFATACRATARLAARRLQQDASARSFRTSAIALAAQNFSMPALSPTMTEGNIASWKVKEGEKFQAGDVLLEIETDKATMDVEAQEDGILMKITQGDGSKGVQVGSRIAVVAEEGDDISSLEIPEEKSEQPRKAAEAPQTQTPETTTPKAAPPTSSAPKAPVKPGHKTSNRTYPLYPSVAHLLKVNGLDTSVAKDITPTGPNGRLLKGDVLAYLGKIGSSAPADVSSRFEKASHLDLSNIKVAAPKPAPAGKAAKPAAAAPSPPPAKSTITLPISLTAVTEAQLKIKETLDVFVPLSTFVARASELANDGLPLPKDYKPSADELFDEILGLSAAKKSSKGHYVPQIGASIGAYSRPTQKRTEDVYDILCGTSKPQIARPITQTPATPAGPNLFSLNVPQGEQKRAQIFLERVRLVLENEPGRLVL